MFPVSLDCSFLIAPSVFSNIYLFCFCSEDWKTNFFPRDLVGLSAEPLLVYPTHYTGEANYFSDTEESVVIPADKAANDEQKEDNFRVPANEATATDQSSKDELWYSLVL